MNSQKENDDSSFFEKKNLIKSFLKITFSPDKIIIDYIMNILIWEKLKI